jgi:uncharacterized membrane protein YjfL (UPF0719 family)
MAQKVASSSEKLKQLKTRGLFIGTVCSEMFRTYSKYSTHYSHFVSIHQHMTAALVARPGYLCLGGIERLSCSIPADGSAENMGPEWSGFAFVIGCSSSKSRHNSINKSLKGQWTLWTELLWL